LVPLALKQHLEGQQIHPEHPNTVDSAVTASTGHLYLDKTCFAQNPLCEPLKSGGF
jgi:hypothetical protein